MMKSGKYLDYDDGIRQDQTLEKLAKLRPFFDRKNGTVTAGNSSQITDAAAGMVLMSESEAKKRGLEPLGYLSEYAYAGLDPKRMGLGPVFSSHKLFKQTGLSIDDMEIVEINEAFAAQSLACTREMGLADDDPRINPNGGAIAIGHPLGMTGARILQTAMLELHKTNKKYALVTLCIGVGQGYATIIERV